MIRGMVFSGSSWNNLFVIPCFSVAERNLLALYSPEPCVQLLESCGSDCTLTFASSLFPSSNIIKGIKCKWSSVTLKKHMDRSADCTDSSCSASFYATFYAQNVSQGLEQLSSGAKWGSLQQGVGYLSRGSTVGKLVFGFIKVRGTDLIKLITSIKYLLLMLCSQ